MCVATGHLGLSTKTKVDAPMLHPLKEVMEVACGLFHSCAVTASGSLYTLGENSHYTCGRGGSEPSLSPEFLLSGAYHSFATLEDGRVVWVEAPK
jgi:alpha-tubulin suppressor-like RCC1 family protein